LLTLYNCIPAESESVVWIVFLKFQEFFINKNSVLISVFGISEKARGVTSKAACGILILFQ
jgi:hypothetical protein